MKLKLLGLPFLFLIATPLIAQRVDSTNTHYRFWAIDRVITTADGVTKPAHADGMLGFVAIYSPDSSICLVEYVAAKYDDFEALRKDKDARVKIFDKAKTKKDVFEAAARRAGFVDLNLDKLIVRVP